MDKASYMSMRDVQKSLIGKGIKYPSMINSRTGDIAVVEDIDLINQSIHAILSTRKGERFMMPEFGTEIHKYLFNPNIFILQDLVTTEIKDCLGRWEQRIAIRNITYEQYESTLEATITYNIRNTSMTGSYVYPINTSRYDMESSANTLYE